MGFLINTKIVAELRKRERGNPDSAMNNGNSRNALAQH